MEPKRDSSDVPEYSTYPAPAPGEDQLRSVHNRYPEVGTAPVESTSGEWASRGSWSSDSQSSGMGRVLEMVKDAGYRVRTRFRSAKSNLQNGSTDEWKRQAQQNIEQARVKFEDTLHRYPMQTLAAIAGASFALGLAIRLARRS